MLRLARRATLLGAFSLLASAATAYAECAWVLWSWSEWDEKRGTAKPSAAMRRRPRWSVTDGSLLQGTGNREHERQSGSVDFSTSGGSKRHLPMRKGTRRLKVTKSASCVFTCSPDVSSGALVV